MALHVEGRHRAVPPVETPAVPEERWVCRARYLGQVCGIEVKPVSTGFGHLAPRRWAHAALPKQVEHAAMDGDGALVESWE
jgi:hypothetical protein